jgi:hypothetical protein
MTLSYDAARANLYHLWQQHADWQHGQFAAALGSSQGWVKKWLKRWNSRRMPKSKFPLVQGFPNLFILYRLLLL